MTAPTPFNGRRDLVWVDCIREGMSEGNAESLRVIAVDIEAALAKDGRGVNLAKPIAIMVKRALFDLAERVEAD